MEDSDGTPTFAFHDLEYIPSGFSGTLAPYIETPAATMRAAATLMRLGLGLPSTQKDVVCDLGCGDGYFRKDTYIHSPLSDLLSPGSLAFLPSFTGPGLPAPDPFPQERFQKPKLKYLLTENSQVIGLLTHINTLTNTLTAHGLGIDYNASLIKSAGVASALSGVNASWLIYNFNDDREDLVGQLITTHQVTHVFVYLVPKQLALKTVRGILTRLCESGVVVCCHKFYPGYLTPARRDVLMDLVVYDETS